MRRAKSERGFTLVELLGVMVIIIILVAISVPAFSSLLRSSRASVADGALRVALSSARDAAVSSLDGGDGAAVFLFEPGGSVSIVTCVRVGRLNAFEGGVGELDVFVADPRFEPQELPKNWLVRGLARSQTTADADDSSSYAWYSSTRYDREQWNWVLPEDGFFNPQKVDEGRKRQTFLVRFDAVTGALDVSDQSPVLVYLPSVDLDRRRAPYREYNPIRESDHVRLVQRMLSNAELPPTQREDLLGDRATDTVLARPVAQIALYDVRDLVRKLREENVTTSVDKRTGSLYSLPPRGQDPAPIFDPDLAEEVNRYLPRVAEVFTIERYSGRPRRLPTREEETS